MILFGCSCPRMVRHAGKQFDFDINKPHRITSGGCRIARSTPASPSLASKTSQSSIANNSARVVRLSASSSIIKTVDIGLGAKSDIGERKKPIVFDARKAVAEPPLFIESTLCRSFLKENRNAYDRNNVYD